MTPILAHTDEGLVTETPLANAQVNAGETPNMSFHLQATLLETPTLCFPSLATLLETPLLYLQIGRAHV